MHKILVIEDENDFARILVKRLTKHGFEVMAAADAVQGVGMAHEKTPDLIILDLMLPAGGGPAALKNIRLSVQTRYIPVVVLTGSANEECKEKILAEGVEAYFEKPCDWDTLIATVNDILKNNRT